MLDVLFALVQTCQSLTTCTYNFAPKTPANDSRWELMFKRNGYGLFLFQRANVRIFLPAGAEASDKSIATVIGRLSELLLWQPKPVLGKAFLDSLIRARP